MRRHDLLRKVVFYFTVSNQRKRALPCPYFPRISSPCFITHHSSLAIKSFSFPGNQDYILSIHDTPLVENIVAKCEDFPGNETRLLSHLRRCEERVHAGHGVRRVDSPGRHARRLRRRHQGRVGGRTGPAARPLLLTLRLLALLLRQRRVAPAPVVLGPLLRVLEQLPVVRVRGQVRVVRVRVVAAAAAVIAAGFGHGLVRAAAVEVAGRRGGHGLADDVVRAGPLVQG